MIALQEQAPSYDSISFEWPRPEVLFFVAQQRAITVLPFPIWPRDAAARGKYLSFWGEKESEFMCALSRPEWQCRGLGAGP